MVHFKQLTSVQIIRGLFIFGVFPALVYMLTSNMGIVAVSGVLLIVTHLIVASGILWTGRWLVKVIIKIHQPQEDKS